MKMEHKISVADFIVIILLIVLKYSSDDKETRLVVMHNLS
jgi:hypothetical protein